MISKIKTATCREMEEKRKTMRRANKAGLEGVDAEHFLFKV
jgi:hypothetical protein